MGRQAKFTEEQIEQALLWLDQGQSRQDVLKKMGCAPSTLHCWIEASKKKDKKITEKIGAQYHKLELAHKALQAKFDYLKMIVEA